MMRVKITRTATVVKYDKVDRMKQNYCSLVVPKFSCLFGR